MENTDLFLERYKPHIQLNGFGVPGQEALTHAKVLVVGAGGLGIPVATYLAAMGLGTLGIADTHLISLSSLSLQPLYKVTQQGEARTDCLAQHLRELNPDVELHLYDAPLNKENVLALVSQFQVVVDAANQTALSYLLNDACVIAGIPCVYGAAHQYQGQLSVFNVKGSATFRCMQADASVDAYRQGGSGQGLLGVVPGMVGCYLAGEVVKLITGIGEPLTNTLLILDVLKNKPREIKLTARPENLQIRSLQPDQVPEEQEVAKQTRFMTPHQLSLKLSYMEPLQLIDIREQQEGPHLEGALHWPALELLHHLDQIHQDLPVVLISRDGEKGREMAGLLNSHYGFGNIHYLQGGMEAWVREENKSLPSG
jgi:sulfur-carrier protein adenylyltransferase/sulfurtransferase